MYSKQRVRGGEGRCSVQPATSAPTRSLARVARELPPPPCHLHTLCEAHPDRTRLQGLHKPPQPPRRLGPAPSCFVGPRPQGWRACIASLWDQQHRCCLLLKKGFSLLAQKKKQARLGDGSLQADSILPYINPDKLYATPSTYPGSCWHHT